MAGKITQEFGRSWNPYSSGENVCCSRSSSIVRTKSSRKVKLDDLSLSQDIQGSGPKSGLAARRLNLPPLD
jgi:hypothetical protein